MRRLALLIAAACPLVLAACGGSSTANRPPVRLTVDEPGDGDVVHARTVQVSGRVSPAGATVTVLGQPAAVSGGSFNAVVPLARDDNVVDVMASAPSTRPAMTAIRVVRQLQVPVPDVTGDSPGNARSRLQEAGLRADVHESGSIFEDLLPTDPSVCDTKPTAGARVDRGSTVRVDTAKVC